MTTTATDLRSLVDGLVREPLDGLDAAALQARIATLTPQVARLQGWLQVAAGQLAHVTGGTLAGDDDGPRRRPRSVPGWLADVQRSTPGATGSQLRTARLLRRLPVVVDAVLSGRLTPAQAAVLTGLVGRIDEVALLEAQPAMFAVAATMDPAQLHQWVAHQIATHCEPAFEAEQERARDRRFLTSLEPLARRAGVDDRRTAGQRRADALTDLAEQVLRHGDLPEAGGARPQLSYVVPAVSAPPRAEAPRQAAAPSAARAVAARSSIDGGSSASPRRAVRWSSLTDRRAVMRASAMPCPWSAPPDQRACSTLGALAWTRRCPGVRQPVERWSGSPAGDAPSRPTAAPSSPAAASTCVSRVPP